jgi:hypothetical protein
VRAVGFFVVVEDGGGALVVGGWSVVWDHRGAYVAAGDGEGVGEERGSHGCFGYALDVEDGTPGVAELEVGISVDLLEFLLLTSVRGAVAVF